MLMESRAKQMLVSGVARGVELTPSSPRRRCPAAAPSPAACARLRPRQPAGNAVETATWMDQEGFTRCGWLRRTTTCRAACSNFARHAGGARHPVPRLSRALQARPLVGVAGHVEPDRGRVPQVPADAGAPGDRPERRGDADPRAALNIFYVLFFAWSAGVLMLSLPLALVPRRLCPIGTAPPGGTLLGWSSASPTRCAASVTVQRAVIIACKHQSAWDTFVFCGFTRDPAFVMKRELMLVPVYGWYLRKAHHRDRPRGRCGGAEGHVARIGSGAGRPRDRDFSARDAHRPGDAPPYQPGVAALYRQLGCRWCRGGQFGLLLGPPPLRQMSGSIVLALLEPICRRSRPGGDCRSSMAASKPARSPGGRARRRLRGRSSGPRSS